MRIIEVENELFFQYGELVTDTQINENVRMDIIKLFEMNTSMPAEGNIYEADFPMFQDLGIEALFNRLMKDEGKLQFGYCHGQNQKVNALEWHDSPEIIFAITPCVLYLGSPNSITRDFNSMTYNTEDLIALRLKKGDLIRLNPNVLHFSPVKTEQSGFMTMIILPKDTNTLLEEKNADPYLFMKNKWMIAHEDRQDLIERGVKPGVIGINYDWNEIQK